MSYEKDDDDYKIKFLYKIKEGSVPESFGINVAKMAHIPDSIIK